jgi:AraC family transcriptional regulator
MRSLVTGQFYGTTNETIHLNGITLTDTEYTHEKVDWHFHENAYFTFILEGKLLEGNKKDLFSCNTGTLLFHNCQEAHYNIKPEGFTRGFHIELDQKWIDSYDIKTASITGSLNLVYPGMKWLMYNIFRETKFSGESGQPAIDALLLELLTSLSGVSDLSSGKRPLWVGKIREILNDTTEELTLVEMAKILNIHPVHLSRQFSRYFNCNLGEYIRTIKLQRALSMLPKKDCSLTDIAMNCNFADQSHFIRSFKAQYQITPSEYRKILLRNQKC